MGGGVKQSNPETNAPDTANAAPALRTPLTTQGQPEVAQVGLTRCTRCRRSNAAMRGYTADTVRSRRRTNLFTFPTTDAAQGFAYHLYRGAPFIGLQSTKPIAYLSACRVPDSNPESARSKVESFIVPGITYGADIRASAKAN